MSRGIDTLIVFDGDYGTISEQATICSNREPSEVSDVLIVRLGDDGAIADQLITWYDHKDD